MNETLEVMKWPVMACLLLPGLLVYLGLHVVRREIIFVDLALAQVAALGTAIGMLLHFEPFSWQNYACSLLMTLAVAAVFAFLRGQNARVPQEALIGIVYVVAAAVAVLVLSRNPEGNEELRRSLLGDILLVTRGQVLQTFAFFLFVGVLHLVFRRQFLAISFGPEKAREQGLGVRWWDFLFYAVFGLVVTSFVRIGGVLLVFSYLIVPAVCANFLTQGIGRMLFIGWGIAIAASIGGVFASYRFDFPTGATIVCSLGVFLPVCMTARLVHARLSNASSCKVEKPARH